LRFGILGAAKIAPNALILPVKNHPDAVVKAIAARDQGRADSFAKTYGIPKAYGGPGAYQSTSVAHSPYIRGIVFIAK
jgi:predicted dehydrogenase